MLAKTEVDKIEDWSDPDNGWYNSDNNWEAPLFNLHVDASITGGRGALFFDSFDQAVWAYFKPAGDETIEAITSTIAELQKFGNDLHRCSRVNKLENLAFDGEPEVRQHLDSEPG